MQDTRVGDSIDILKASPRSKLGVAAVAATMSVVAVGAFSIARLSIHRLLIRNAALRSVEIGESIRISTYFWSGATPWLRGSHRFLRCFTPTRISGGNRAFYVLLHSPGGGARWTEPGSETKSRTASRDGSTRADRLRLGSASSQQVSGHSSEMATIRRQVLCVRYSMNASAMMRSLTTPRHRRIEARLFLARSTLSAKDHGV